MSTRLFIYYDKLEDLGLPTTEANMLRHLRGRINMGGSLEDPYYISVWQAAVDAALLDHMSSDTVIDFAHWTTLLVNDEAKFKNNARNDSARISSASAPHNKNKNSTRYISSAEACDDFSCGEYETDTDSSTSEDNETDCDSLSSEDDDYSTSSDGSGDISIH